MFLNIIITCTYMEFFVKYIDTNLLFYKNNQ